MHSAKENHHWETILSMKKTQPMSLGLELERHAAQQPSKTALIYEDLKFTYDEFNQEANRYANAFALMGLKKRDVVALMMQNRPGFLFAVAGLSKLGVIPALINTSLRGEALAQGINQVDAKVLIVGHEILDVFATVAQRIRLYAPGHVFVDSPAHDFKIPKEVHTLNTLANMQTLRPILKGVSVTNPPTTAEITTDDVLVYMFTSGHKGLRKAVPVLQKRWLQVGHRVASFGRMHPDSVQYMALPLQLNSGFNVCFSGMLVTGSTMVLKKQFHVHRFWDDVKTYNCDYLVGVGEMARYLLSAEPLPEDKDNPLTTMLCAGMLQEVEQPFRERFGIEHVFEIYGATEGVGVFVNYDEKPGMCGNLTLHGERQGEVVQYDPENDTYVLDAKGHAIKCQPGEVGLLVAYLNELNPFPGYLKDPEATEAKLLRNVFEAGDLFYNTDDLMMLHEDDYISFVDRLGDTYRWKGRTVSADAVADVVFKFFGPIEDATVYGMKIPGFEGRCGMAALVLMADEAMEWDRFAQHLSKRMPEHARPLFVRILSDVQADVSISDLRKQLQQEGFDPNTIKDPIYFLDPRKNDIYVPLTEALYQEIVAGKVQF